MSNNIAKITIIDEVNCVVLGLKDDHVSYLSDEYAKYAPNYFFNPKFKLGQWDGRVRYFHKTGKTYVYLLDEIVPKLVRLGYKIKLVDKRASSIPEVPLIDENYFAHITHPEWAAPITLRPYQVRAVNSVIQNNGGIIIAGTGAGKTLMTAALADSYGKMGLRTITIVPAKDLIEQTAREFETCQLDVGRYYGEVKDHSHLHVVSTWQSLQNNPSLLNDFSVIIVDECHGIRGQVLQQLLNEHGAHIPLRFGLTGTLPKAQTDAMAVRVTVGDVQYTITARELMDQGYLAKLNIDVLQLEEHFKDQYQEYCDNWKPTVEEPKLATYRQFCDSYFPDYTSEKKYLQSKKDRMQWIADYIAVKRDMGKGNVFCLVGSVKLGQKLASMVEGAYFVHGQDKQKARQEIYDLFKDHDNIVVIATINIAAVGLNIKRIFHMMVIDAGKSFIRIIQSIGRGLRKAPDKDSVDFTDICSDLKYSRKHLTERKKYYREAQYPYKVKKVDYANF